MTLVVWGSNRRKSRASVRPAISASGGERRGRHLVEQGLEQVMVALVEERDANAGNVQLPGRDQAAEAAAQDDDVGLLFPQHVAQVSLVDDRRIPRFQEAAEM